MVKRENQKERKEQREKASGNQKDKKRERERSRKGECVLKENYMKTILPAYLFSSPIPFFVYILSNFGLHKRRKLDDLLRCFFFFFAFSSEKLIYHSCPPENGYFHHPKKVAGIIQGTIQIMLPIQPGYKILSTWKKEIARNCVCPTLGTKSSKLTKKRNKYW